LVMMGASIPQALALAAFQHLQSQERMWLSFFAIVLPRDLLLASLAIYLIPRHGVLGLGWAYATAWSVALIIVVAIILRDPNPSNVWLADDGLVANAKPGSS
jgi:Na+-driven multidrug efflux pump